MKNKSIAFSGAICCLLLPYPYTIGTENEHADHNIAQHESVTPSNSAQPTNASPGRGLTRRSNRTIGGIENHQNRAEHRIAPGLVEQSLAISDYRTMDGSGNNPFHPQMGAAGNELNRWCPAEYVDQISEPVSNGYPSPRVISNQMFDQPYSRPNLKNASDFLWQWGQFLDHDLDLTDGIEPAEPMPIAVPIGDVYFDPNHTGIQTIPFNRSIYNPESGSNEFNPRQQINEITAWIDASHVYGSDVERATELRTMDGTGHLKTSAGGLLPFNVNHFPNAGGDGDELFLGGDVRANEQIGLTTMHTLFVREHNRLATLIAQNDASLSGEEIYQKTRRLVGAMMQFITYEEFLPTLLGPNAIPPYQGYNSKMNASIANMFSTVAFRFGHSALSPVILRLDAQGFPYEQGHLELRDAFFAPWILSEPGAMESILRGLSSQVCQSIDHYAIDDIRNFLFGPPGAGGLDLVSLNIQRGRDHGLAQYNTIRLAINLPAKASFSDISQDAATTNLLAQTYPSIDQLDAWVGGLAEDHVEGALVGELFYHIIRNQFLALRDGDRFWYQNDLDTADIEFIQTSTLANIIRRNTDIDTEITDNVFLVSNLADQDNDNIEDIRDNCLETHNPRQIDADSDGYGNYCDIDLNNDGKANFLDLNLFANDFLSANAISDFNSDGYVDGLDLAIFRQYFLKAVGPSGLHQ